MAQDVEQKKQAKDVQPKSPLQEPWFPWVLAVVTLVIGIIGGFLGGVAVGERGDLRRDAELPVFQDSGSDRGGWYRGSANDMNSRSSWQ